MMRNKQLLQMMTENPENHHIGCVLPPLEVSVNRLEHHLEEII